MLPRCCGVEMIMKIDTGKLIEIECPVCMDVVYIKKHGGIRPQMIDD